MNFNKSQCANLAVFALSITVAFPAGVLAQSPAAQQPSQTTRRSQNQPAGTTVQSLMNGLNVGPLLMSFGGASGIMIDFSRSNVRLLIERSDVRSELFIDSVQREKLADLDQQNTQMIQRKMMETVIQNTVNNPDFKALAKLGTSQNPNPGVVQDVLNSSFQAMQDGLQSVQTTMDASEEAILNPKQIKRLHELDLQWRGPLALSDKKVADELTLTADQKATVAAALKAYQTTQTAVLEPIMAQAMEYSQETSNNRRAPRTFNQQQMQSVLANAMDSDAMRKARSAAEDKVKASLTPEQLTKWKTMQGQKFYFTRLD